jgi:TP901 family phage tail tape measure protein
MGDANVVKILISADSAPATAGFDETAISAEEMAAKVTAAMGEFTSAQDEAAAAQARVTGLEKSGAATAEELAAANNELTAAVLRSMDAQVRLGQAELEQSARERQAAAEAAEGYDTETAAMDRQAAAAVRLRAEQNALTEATARQEAALRELAGTAGASADEQAAALARVEAADTEVASRTRKVAAAQDEAAEASSGWGSKLKLAALGVGIGMGVAVKGAANLQQETTKLVTSAGESAKNLGLVQRGILALSSSADTGSKELASGMYMVESAGFHGAEGLTVLKAAAEGAKAEGADLADVANAVTSGLNAYGLKASQATSFTNEMVTAVGQGKMTMQDLASSLSAVLPIAASAHISFAQVAGAIATMTSQGMSARQASQDLASSIHSLLAPNNVAIQEMSQFGISSVHVSEQLGKRGLTGTIGYLAEQITSRMGKSGVVLLKTFNQSRSAAADAQTMLSKLPPTMRALAQSYLDGKTSYNTWYQATKAAPPLVRNLATQFATVANKAHGFNQLLASGNPDAQTFAAALGKMMGGATGLNTALMLTGPHAATFSKNVSAIAGSARKAGGDVKGWSKIQGEANFQLGSAAKAAEAMGDSLGMALLPTVTAVLKPLTGFLNVVAKNKIASAALAVMLGSVLAGALGSKLAGALSSTKSGIESVGSGAKWLAGKLGLMTAATEEQAAASGEAEVAQDGLNLAFLVSPIGLIVEGIALLVIGFIELWKHCKAFRDFWKDAWKVVAAIGVEAWHIIDGGMIHPLIQGIGDLIAWIRSHWTLVLAILTGPVGLAVLWVARHWRELVSGAEHMVSDVTGFFRRLPGDILHAVAGFGRLLLRAGQDLLLGLIHGIESQVSYVVRTAEGVGKSILRGIEGALGIASPSKEGHKRGQMLGLGLANGMDSMRGVLRAAAQRMGRAMLPSVPGMPGLAGGGFPALAGYGGGSGRPVQVVLRPEGGDAPLMNVLLRLLRAEVRATGGGGTDSVQRTFGQRW